MIANLPAGRDGSWKIKMSLTLVLVLPAYFALDALCVNWDDPESQTIDEMFAGDYGSVYGDLPFPGPQASRAAQSGEPHKEIINLPIGGNRSTATGTSQQTEIEGQNQIATTQPLVASVAAQNQPRPTSASGTWKLEIIDDTSRNATVMLYQSGDTVFGKGEIQENNNTTLTTTASGTVAADKLTLDLVAQEEMRLYRLLLTIDGDLASGSYTEFGINDEPTTGTVKGARAILLS